MGARNNKWQKDEAYDLKLGIRASKDAGRTYVSNVRFLRFLCSGIELTAVVAVAALSSCARRDAVKMRCPDGIDQESCA